MGKFANEGKEADTQVVMTMLNIRGKLCSDVRLFSELNNGSYMRHAAKQKHAGSGLLSAADESYHLEPLYACGVVLPVAVLDALTAQAFYMPKAIEVVECMAGEGVGEA